MSVIRKKPFIEDLIEDLSDEQKSDLLDVMNGAGNTIDASFTNMPADAISSVLFKLENNNLKTGILVQSENYNVLLAYHRFQDMQIFKLDTDKFTFEKVNEYLDINELRRVLAAGNESGEGSGGSGKLYEYSFELKRYDASGNLVGDNAISGFNNRGTLYIKAYIYESNFERLKDLMSSEGFAINTPQDMATFLNTSFDLTTAELYNGNTNGKLINGFILVLNQCDFVYIDSGYKNNTNSFRWNHAQKMISYLGQKFYFTDFPSSADEWDVLYDYDGEGTLYVYGLNVNNSCTLTEYGTSASGVADQDIELFESEKVYFKNMSISLMKNANQNGAWFEISFSNDKVYNILSKDFARMNANIDINKGLDDPNYVFVSNILKPMGFDKTTNTIQSSNRLGTDIDGALVYTITGQTNAHNIDVQLFNLANNNFTIKFTGDDTYGLVTALRTDISSLKESTESYLEFIRIKDEITIQGGQGSGTVEAEPIVSIKMTNMDLRTADDSPDADLNNVQLYCTKETWNNMVAYAKQLDSSLDITYANFGTIYASMSAANQQSLIGFLMNDYINGKILPNAYAEDIDAFAVPGIHGQGLLQRTTTLQSANTNNIKVVVVGYFANNTMFPSVDRANIPYTTANTVITVEEIDGPVIGSSSGEDTPSQSERQFDTIELLINGMFNTSCYVRYMFLHSSIISSSVTGAFNQLIDTLNQQASLSIPAYTDLDSFSDIVAYMNDLPSTYLQVKQMFWINLFVGYNMVALNISCRDSASNSPIRCDAKFDIAGEDTILAFTRLTLSGTQTYSLLSDANQDFNFSIWVNQLD